MILAAALELLGEVGYGGLTIEGVAARAGVGKSTIYRHWPGKLEVVEDALGQLRPAPFPPPAGTVRERVVALLSQVAGNLADSAWSRCLPAMVDAAERDPGMLALHRRLSQERLAVLVGVLAEGVETGEVPPGADVQLLAEMLVGPIIVRRLLLHEPFDPAAVPRLVALVLASP